jgi:uncharacterized BrkB/YihY/UPF0761 family membrane protein
MIDRVLIPVWHDEENGKRPFYRKKVFIVAVIAFALGVLIGASLVLFMEGFSKDTTKDSSKHSTLYDHHSDSHSKDF